MLKNDTKNLISVALTESGAIVPKTFVSECENLHNFIKKTNDTPRTKVDFQTGN
jgi:hypothetical protein